MLTLITGGERSGKSSHAQQMAQSLTDSPIYIATAELQNGDDHDFTARIARHRSDRDARWSTIEEPLHLGNLELSGKVVVIDCVTLWLANIWKKFDGDLDSSLTFARAEFAKMDDQSDTSLFVVTNELGMGVHASTHSARKFVEFQGFINQHIARLANRVIFMVSGIPMTIKET